MALGRKQGGAWDNAKKYIAAGGLGPDKRKHTPQHDAAVIGDTVGDPLKDTSGPSLNILIKLVRALASASSCAQSRVVCRWLSSASSWRKLSLACPRVA